MNRNDSLRQSLTTSLFFGSILMVLLPVTFFALATGSDTFTASATINNQAPTITIAAGQTWTGSSGLNTTQSIYFNATDSNGASDINDSTATATINQSGTTIVATVCGAASTLNSSSKQYQCNFTLAYYHAEGTWTIEANVSDNSASAATATTTGTVGTLDSVSVVDASISFSGNPGQSDIAATENAQQLNNTGNQNYASVNLTGYDFQSGANILTVGNVTVNVSNSALGQSLANGTEVVIDSAALTSGQNSLEDLYFFLDIPATQANGAYSAQASWTLEAIQ